MGKRDFSGIRSYDELEAALGMVRSDIVSSNVSQQVSHFKAQGGIQWTDVALLAIQALKKCLR